MAIPLCLFLLGAAAKKWQKVFWAADAAVSGPVRRRHQVARRHDRAGVRRDLLLAEERRRRSLTGAVAVAGLALVLVAPPRPYFERMSTISSHEDGSSQGRIAAWNAAVQMAIDNPLFGVGAGHFPVKFGAEYRKADCRCRGMTAHSIYFLILGELGLPGIGMLRRLHHLELDR